MAARSQSAGELGDGAPRRFGFAAGDWLLQPALTASVFDGGRLHWRAGAVGTYALTDRVVAFADLGIASYANSARFGVDVWLHESWALTAEGRYIDAAVRGADDHSTLLHECVHATGHSSRLDRLQDRKVEDEYAREELVAEIGSAYLCAEVGVARNDEQHAAYIGAWLKQLKSKDGAHILAGAAKDAGKAADWLIERVPQREQEHEKVMRVHRERNGAER